MLAIDRIEDALPLCRALVDDGLPVLEITLRTACALDAIARSRASCRMPASAPAPCCPPTDLAKVAEAGARFAISPGATDTLFDGREAAPCR